MAAKSPEERRASARLAAQTRHSGANDPALTQLRTEMREARAIATVKRIMAEAPALNDETRRRMAALIVNGGGQT